MADTATGTGRDWLSRYTAKMRELHGGRPGPFAVGDRVTCRGNWGPLVDLLRIHSDRHPGYVYTIHEVKLGGSYYALRDDDGNVYFGGVGGIGPCYFRIAGECGDHFPQYREGAYHGVYACARCDQVMPEVTEILRREAPSA
jgi:hypothetical protein